MIKGLPYDKWTHLVALGKQLETLDQAEGRATTLESSVVRRECEGCEG